ncbi:signal peptidase [Bacillus glycinifermentans]|uniref:signal peptidase I SipW n=1 Tax=Bacillus glycinifermentans TaxID=1664069 RepID=UPI000653DF16|nr:signal peptidase I [Bacillus glycinifermentans]KMM63321.1 signal peptidase [Bacillus glycinifermentans]MEC0496017.1 signal peptidase I [Bacillus glycinifermentans]MEC0539136.1 signal peptidase I [Bacillus glycinifermentans]MEC3606048.1 signal peptidase I [Bacillus glycinifermentans]UOY89792.1 signal peptidase I [Bacillus glycinifermentans]
MRKIMKWVSNILYVIIFTLIIATVIVVISTKSSGGEPQLFGYQLKTVLSGSMEPEFKTGSIIAVQKVDNPEALKKGDIITFMQDQNTMVTHRIIGITKNKSNLMFQTKGDNNQNPDSDPVLSENVVAKYSGITVPYAGYLLDFAGKPIGTAILLIVPGLLLILYAVITVSAALREIEQKAKAIETAGKDRVSM